MEGTDFDRIMALCGDMELEKEPEPIKAEEAEDGTKLRIHTERGKKIFDKRRFFSEKSLMDAMDWYWHPGKVYHVLTGGDVDFLSFLRFALRQQPAEYMLISSWCYGVEDVAEIASWVERGYAKRLDAYMGEIAAASYAMCQEELAQATGKTGGRQGGRDSGAALQLRHCIQRQREYESTLRKYHDHMRSGCGAVVQGVL